MDKEAQGSRKNEARPRKSPRTNGSKSKPGKPKPGKSKDGVGTNDFGNALRSAYDRTLNEAIPPEMLDLLGKLG